MADTTALKNRIRAAVKANNNQEITGPVLQRALLDIVDELNGGTEAEASIRSNADAALQQSITTEKNRAEGAESTLEQAITTEEDRAERAESTLQQNITAEKNRAERAESTLQQNITAEKNRAERAESTLQQNITAEKNRAEGAENALQQNIFANKSYNTSDFAGDHFYNLTQGVGGTAPDVQVLSNDYACLKIEVKVGQTINLKTIGGKNARAYALTDINRTILSVAPVNANYSSGITLNVEQNGYLYVNTTTAFLPNVSVIIPGVSRIDMLENDVSELNNSTEAEASTRSNADAALQQGITTEKNRAEEAESTLQQGITTEKNRAERAESTLQQNITAEKNRAEGAESTLQQNITAEKNRAEEAESTLQQGITTEKNRAEEAESILQQAIRNLRDAGYAFGGVAVTETDPSIISGNCFYIARGAGTYIYFKDADNESIVFENDGIYVLTYESVENRYWEWNKIIGIDDEPTAGSNNLVKSGGIAAVNGYYGNNELWRWVILDSQNRILLGLQSDGTLQWYAGIPAHLRQYISEQIGELREVVEVNSEMVEKLASILDTNDDSEERVSVTIDADDKIVNFRDKTGMLHELAGIITPQIQSPTIETLSERIERIDGIRGIKYNIIFASYDSSESDKAAAAYVCSETNAQEVIQKALDDWYAANEYNAGCFYFCAGTYVMTHFIEPDPESDDKYGTPYCIVLPRGKNKGTGRDHYPTFCHIEGAYDNRRPGVTFLLSRDAYLLKRDGTTEALQDFHEDSSVYQPETTIDNITYPARYLDDSKRYSVIRTVSDSEEQGYSRWCAHGIKIKNIIFKADGDENNRRLTQYPIVMIDGLYASDIDLENLQVSGNKEMLSADQGADNHNVGFTGIRCNQGQSTGTHQHMKGILVANFYHGIEFGSEHWLIQDVTIRQNHIGIAFGCYHDTWGSGHPNVFSCMALEVNAIPMYFYYNKLFDSLNWIGGRNIYMTGVGTELNKYLSSEIETDGCHIEHTSASPIGFINWSSSSQKHLFDTGSLNYLTQVQINNNRIPKSAYWVNLKDKVAEHGQIVYLLEEKCFVVWNNYYDKINKPLGYWEMIGAYTPNENIIEEIISEIN